MEMQTIDHRHDAPAHVPAEDEVPDRRRGPRQKVLKGALVVFRGGYCTMPCYILDISETGAQLMPLDSVFCPKEFMLTPRDGRPRGCEVVWRKSGRVGVRYL